MRRSKRKSGSAEQRSGEAAVAEIASLVVKLGALAFILFLPTQYALDLQLLGGLWILQTFPPLVFGLYTPWFRAGASCSAGRPASAGALGRRGAMA